MDNYVDLAEKAIKGIKDDYGALPTTSQIRKFLTAVNKVSVTIEQEKKKNPDVALNEDLQMQIKFLKVKLAYQVGRAEKKWNEKAHTKVNLVEVFKDRTKLIDRIDAIGNSAEAYEKFARYVEALVAFHKYYGGRD